MSSTASIPAQSIFFNAHHSPIGAFASLTFGCKGAKGGLGLELAGPADENLYVGAEDADSPGLYRALPFFGDFCSKSAAYDQQVPADLEHRRFGAFEDDEISRSFRASTDEWRARDLVLRVISPVVPVPDPDTASDEQLADALCPAVLIELSLDNRKGRHPRKVFLGYQGSDRTAGMRTLQEPGLAGIGQGLRTAIAASDEMSAAIAWDPIAALELPHKANASFLVANLGLVFGTVPAGEQKTFRLVVCFHRAGTVTAGLPCRYLYNRWFEDVEEVARYALERFDLLLERSGAADRELGDGLSEPRALSVAHAVRSYYGSTQLLEDESGKPLWVVNEGEYRMMNTLDLIVDQALYELRLNPWTVRNELEWFYRRYRYCDELSVADHPTGQPGGIAFTHDMGASNNFSRPGFSAYEKAGLTGCFSYMTCEELTNWALTACLYARFSGDRLWTRSHLATLGECLQSILNRDHPDPAHRNGVMSFDSSRCEGGAEITTYDSLDASLGQARNNLYLAVKWWATLVLMETVFREHGQTDAADEALAEAVLTAGTVCSSADEDGLLPAVLGSDRVARIIPVIESLVFPLVAGVNDALDPRGRFGALLRVLEAHFQAVLQPGICKFSDGGWKLSSTSDNSWLSKIYLCQFVASSVFGIDDPESDKAHWAWLTDPRNAYYAWSDQMLAGIAVGSRYYPRGVTSILWTTFGLTSERRQPARAS